MIEPRTLDTLLHPQFDADGAEGRNRHRQRLWPLPPALPAARSSSPLRTPRNGRPAGREGRSGPSGDLSGGHRGHEGCPGYPDRPRRHDLPRGRCCPRHGHLLRIRLRRHQDGRGEQEVRRWPARPTTRATGSPSTAPPATSTTASSPPSTPPSPASSAASWAGPTSTASCRSAPTPIPRTTPRRLASFGAQGIGLCRTEHMFFDGDRIAAIREMICSDTVEAARSRSGQAASPCSRATSRASTRPWRASPSPSASWIRRSTSSCPPRKPTSSCWPRHRARPLQTIKAIIACLHEFNPMMGHRGCRLAVTYPEIAVMQTTRCHQGCPVNVQAKHPDWNIVPEIMIPLVGEVKELAYVKGVVVETADALIKEAGIDMHYKVGTMIEIPRAALTADRDRQGGRVLLLRHQRPDPDDLRLQP